MPIQPPSDRTLAKGGPPVFNPALSAGDPPATQKNETNPISYPRPTIHDSLLTIHSFTKRTQFQHHTHPAPLAEGQSRFIGEPNLPHAHHPPTQKYETNPISLPPSYRWRLADPRPKNAKRTQSTSPDTLTPAFPSHITQNEPNPPKPTAKSHDPKMRNEPNFPFRRPPAALAAPFYAKQTQFHPAGHPKCENKPNPRTGTACRAPTAFCASCAPSAWLRAGFFAANNLRKSAQSADKVSLCLLCLLAAKIRVNPRNPWLKSFCAF